MRKQAKILIAMLCAVATFVPAGLAGVAGTMTKVEAADNVTVTTEDASNTFYYDLADGAYYLSGATIKVDGVSKNSGDTLTIPGDYMIEVTNAGNNPITTKTEVVLFDRGDVHPDGKMGAADLVAMLRYQQGYEISKAGTAAIEITDDVFVNTEDKSLLKDFILERDGKVYTSLEKTHVKQNYNDGSSSEMPIIGFTSPFANYDTNTEFPEGALRNTLKDDIFKKISDLGINLITMSENVPASGERVEDLIKEELRLAEKYGIGVTVGSSYFGNDGYQTAANMKNYLAEYGAYSSFKGLDIIDEPNGTNNYPVSGLAHATMGTRAEIAKLVNQYSNLLGYTNLYPYVDGKDDKWGTKEQYKAYLQEYIETYNPKQISLDAYPFGDYDIYNDPDEAYYLNNLTLIREAAQGADIPFWMVCQAGGWFTTDDQPLGRQHYPTEGQSRWQVHTALAFGAKGITYYPLIQPIGYSNTLGDPDYTRSGLIGADGNTNEWYDYAKAINQQIKAVDNVLMESTNMGVMTTRSEDLVAEDVSNVNGPALTSYNELQSVTATYTSYNWWQFNKIYYGALVGCFDYYGTTALYVVNYDHENARDITLNFNSDYDLTVIQDAKTSVVTTSSKAHKISMKAGEGVLVLVNNPANNITDTSKVQAVRSAITALPDVTTCEMPKSYTNVLNTQKLYEALNTVERAQISDDQKNKLFSLVELTEIYGVVYNEALSANGTAGVRGADATYGNMTTLSVNGVTTFTDTLKQANIPTEFGEVIFYVYNPTGSDVNATYCGVSVTLTAGAWTKVVVPSTSIGNNNSLTFASAVSGNWLVTDYYGKNTNDLLARVNQAIADLPSAALLSLDDKAQVESVRAMYDSLSEEEQVNVENYQKLLDCEAQIAILEAELEGVVPLVIDLVKNGMYGVAEGIDKTLVTDETHGNVMTLGSGAGYFAIEKTQQTEKYKNCSSAYLYIYNPTSEKAYVGTQLGDNGWVKRNFVTLNPGEWNKVELFDRGAVQKNGDTSMIENYLTLGDTVYIYAVDSAGAETTFAGDGWKVSGVYGMNEYGLVNVAGHDVVLDVTTSPLGGTNTDQANVEGTAFGTVLSFTSAESISLSPEQKSQAFKLCKDVVTYIYNPTDNAVIMSLTTEWNYYEFFQLQPKSWNRIVLSDYLPISGRDMVTSATTIWFDPYVVDETTGDRTVATFPAATDGEKWMISNFYGIPSAKDDGSAAAVEALINALPDPTTIKMPDNMKDLAAIDEAKKAYDALTSEQLTFMNAEATAKLNACLAATEGYTVVANAKTDTMLKAPDAVFEGSIDKEIHETAGPVFAMNVTSKANTSYAAGFRIEKDMSNRRIVFSIYNPTQSATELWLYADNWNDLGTQSIIPGWNKITLELNASQATGAVFGFIPGSFDVTNTKWLITSFYSVSDEAYLAEEVAKVELLLQGMPSADDITTLDDTDKIASVQNARAAYEALGDNQSLVNTDLVQKLVDCEAKIAALNAKPEGYVAYMENPAPHFDYYNDDKVTVCEAYSGATLAPVAIAGETAQWSATVNITNQNGGYLRAYQGLNLTVEQLQEYQAQGYTHIRIPYYLEAPVDTAIYVHNNGWEWNYKEAAAAVRNAWTNFDYPIEDLLMTYGGTTTILEGINTVKGAFGLMNIQVNAVGTYKLYLGQAEMWKPEDVAVTYNSATGHWFDYYYGGDGDVWTDAQLADTEVAGQTAKWSGSVNITATGAGYLRAYQGLNITVAELQAYKDQGYTHVRIPYYLEAPADTSIYVHNNTWEWDYKLSAAAVRNEWTNFDYPIDDLLSTYNDAGTTVLEGINSNGRQAFGLMNIQANAVGTYKLYLGEAVLR